MSEILVPYPEFVRGLFSRSGDPSKDFTHAILGIVTEIHEYLHAADEINGIEELGDGRFYLVALGQVISDHLGRPLVLTDAAKGARDALLRVGYAGAPEAIAVVCNQLLDDAKRWVGYGKEPKDLDDIWHMADALMAVANVSGPFPSNDTDRIDAANQRKLLLRYKGGKFDAEAQVIRDREAERDVIASA